MTGVDILNGTYTRITTTDDVTLQANGFQTEQWQSDEGPTVTLSYVNNCWQFAMGSLVECTSTTSNLSAPWEETVGWDGDSYLSVTGTVVKIGGDSSGGNNNSDTETDKTPVYRVSYPLNDDYNGVNGDYWNSGLSSSWGKPIYTNGTYYIGYYDVGSTSYISTGTNFDDLSDTGYVFKSRDSSRITEDIHTGDYEPIGFGGPYAIVTKL